MGYTYDIVKDGRTIACYPYFFILQIIRIEHISFQVQPPKQMLITCHELIDKFAKDIVEIEVMQNQTFPKVKEELLERIKEVKSLDQLYKVVEQFHETKCKLFTVYKYDEISWYQDAIEKLKAFANFLSNYQQDEYEGEFSC
jgi:hypothetical protein